jgi:hypothetical protein
MGEGTTVMVKFVPFRGIRYSLDKVDTPASTPVPFFDNISPPCQGLSTPFSLASSSASPPGALFPRRSFLAIACFPGRSFSHANIRT